MYCYAGLGMIFMQCSGVNSENSNIVNFDSMYSPAITHVLPCVCVLVWLCLCVYKVARIDQFFFIHLFTQVLRHHRVISDCNNIKLGHADVVQTALCPFPSFFLTLFFFFAMLLCFAVCCVLLSSQGSL